MSFQRDHFKPFFYKGSEPLWACSCGASLTLGPHKFRETAESLAAHSHEAWEPDWENYRWAAPLKCSKCDESGIAAGRARLDVVIESESGDEVTVERIFPHYLDPVPQPFKIPDKCPREVAELLQEAFRLYWAFPSSAAARIRSSLELLLNSLRIPQKKKTRRGTFQRLSLHDRIEAYGAKYPKMVRTATRMLAVKWLGNEGAHKSLKNDDVLDGFELMEATLNDLFSGHDEYLDKQAKAIIARKGRATKRVR